MTVAIRMTLPAGWALDPLKRHLQRNDSGAWGFDPTGEEGVPVLRSTEQTVSGEWSIVNPALRALSPQERNSTILRRGDLVVTKSSGSALHIGKTTLVRKSEAGRYHFGNFMQRLRTRSTILPRYLWYVMNSTFIREQVNLSSTTTTGLANLNGTVIGALQVPVPNSVEQGAIADFLDRETAKIDALIDKQTQMIDLLRTRRREVIWAVVTKGTSGGPMVPVWNSPWVSEVPEGWSVTRIHYDYDVVLGKMLDAGRQRFDDDVDTPYVRAANIQDDGLSLDDVNTMPFRPFELDRLSLLRGDLLVVEGGSVGTVHYIDRDMPGWSFQKTVNRVRSRGPASTRFLAYVLRCFRDRGIIDLICDGSTIAHLTAEKLRSLRVPRPPYEIQERLADDLDRETGQIDALIAKAEEFVALARERRAALITAAVTGQIDVREGALA